MLRNPASWLLLAAVALLAGCGSRDPYRRTDVWRPTGANAANLAAMVANPHDLIDGRGSDRQLTKAQELAVQRIWLDKPKSMGGGAGGGGGSGGSGAGGAGGGAGPGPAGG